MNRTAEAGAELDGVSAMAPTSVDRYASSRVRWFRPEDLAHMLEDARKAELKGSALAAHSCQPQRGG